MNGLERDEVARGRERVRRVGGVCEEVVVGRRERWVMGPREGE